MTANTDLTWQELQALLYEMKGVEASVEEIKNALCYAVMLTTLAEQILYLRGANNYLPLQKG